MSLFSPLFLVMSVALTVLAASMLIPASLSIFYQTGNEESYFYSALICMSAAVGFWLVGFTYKTQHLFTRQMFLITGGTWLMVPVFGCLPFLLNSTIQMSVTDAAFETISGVTTTGATVLIGLDTFPRDMLLWRSLLQWLGGIGIICMAVAILPFLKVGGMRLFKTESSLFTDDNVPRAQKLVKSIIIIYIILSLLCTIAYGFSGMSWFDAINHGLTTVATGGYATSDASFGNQSLQAQWVGVVFMLSGSVPFICYVQSAHDRNPRAMLNSQILILLAIISVTSGLLAWELFSSGQETFFTALTLGFFNVTSVITTTGFASSDYMTWGTLTIAVMFFATFIGGCSGSTSGGTKIFRLQVLFVLLQEHLRRAVHPRLIWNRSYNGQPLGSEIVAAVAAYLLVLIASLILLTLGLSAYDLDLITSVSGAASALMNVGPGLGDIIGPAGNFSSLPDGAKWLLCAGMLLGRLEFLAILILFTVSFWRG